MSSQMTSRRISPRYRPDMSFYVCRKRDITNHIVAKQLLTSNACSPGLFDISSTIASYFVRGRCSCSNESKAPLRIRAFLRGPSRKTKGCITNPFTIDGHVSIRRDAQVCNLGNVANMFHICGITTSPKNDGYLRSRAHVVRCYECAGGVIDERCQVNRKILLHQSLLMVK